MADEQPQLLIRAGLGCWAAAPEPAGKCKPCRDGGDVSVLALGMCLYMVMSRRTGGQSLAGPQEMALPLGKVSGTLQGKGKASQLLPCAWCHPEEPSPRQEHGQNASEVQARS